MKKPVSRAAADRFDVFGEVWNTEKTEEMFRKEMRLLEEKGMKNSALRLEYEEKVRSLAGLKKELEGQGLSEEAVARRLHGQRRELGRQYKLASPPLIRQYIYYATEKKYGDPLGPEYKVLRRRKTDGEIIESAVRPIRDLDERISTEGFEKWFREIYRAEKEEE